MTVAEEDTILNHLSLVEEIVRELDHDIRVADTMIQGSEDILKKIRSRPDDDTTVRIRARYNESLEYAREQKQKLLELMSTVQQGKIAAPYNPTTLDLVGIINDAVTICTGMLDDQRIELLLGYDAASTQKMMFQGDQVRARTVLMNIFSNMRRALSGTENPRIRIGIYDLRESQERADTGRIVMSNNGPRLPFDTLEDAFKPYKSGSGSKGLGLAICRDIIEEKFKGRIYTAHPAAGGVAFYIELPLCR
ncbi:MAG: hypothetical protein KKD17_00535 [Nanoarchaeota archaeon]|nr:hypothetical protein [Nanoarchaeota archaeon]